VAVYDDQKKRASTGDPNKVTGVGEKAESKMEQAGRAGSRNDLADRENSNGFRSPSDVGRHDGSRASAGASDGAGAKSSQSTSDQQNDSGSFASRAIRRIGGIDRKKAAAGGGLSTFVAAAAFMFFTVASGPFQAIHAGQLLAGHFGPQNSFSDAVGSKFMIYALAGKAAKGRLGVVRNLSADKWEKRMNQKGLKSVYSQGTGRLIGYEILDENKAGKFLDDMGRDGIPRADSLPGTDANGNPNESKGSRKFVDLRDNKFGSRRSVTRTAVGTLGHNKISSFLGSRLLIKRAGVNFHVLNNVKKKADQRTADYVRERQEERARQAETGSIDPNAPESPTKSKLSGILDRLKVFANTAKGPALAIIATCAAKSFGESIDVQNLANQQTSMRMGMEMISVGSQAQSNQDLDAEELGAVVDQLYDEETQTSWDDDPGVQSEAGERPTGKDYLVDSKPGAVEAPLFFRIADKVPVGAVCDAIASAASLPVIQQASDLLGFLVDLALKPFGTSSEELMQMAIDYFTGGAVDTLAQGSKRGGYMNSGARLAANNQMIANGGTELTEAEAQAVKKSARLEQKELFDKSSVYDKYANIYNGQSVAATTLAQFPQSPSHAVAMLTRLPATLSSVLMQFSGLSRVYAQTVAAPFTYDYGFPLYGYTLGEQANEDYENPYANQAYMQADDEPDPDKLDRLERMNAEYGNACFFMEISRAEDLIYGESGDPNKIPAKCKDRSNVELTHYRFYMAQVVTAITLDCYEETEEACKQIGFGGGTPAPAAQTGTGDAASLATQLLALEGTKVSFTQPLAKQALQEAASGQPSVIEARCGTGTTSAMLSPVLLQALLDFTSTHTIGIGYLTNGCHSSGSDHYSGQAVDLNQIDGRRATGGDADRAFMQEATGILPDGSAMGEVQCSNIAIRPINRVRLFEDSCNHVHISVP